jgi:glycosyltransferase involved in cell wall biosynthesis
MQPLISVIIPTYNYAGYILDAVDSVCRQDYPDDKIEIIIVDDGSTDNTEEILQGLIKSKRIHYFYQQNKGKAAATYKGIQLANGSYLFNLDADDYFLPGKIKRTIEIFESNHDIVHVATPAKFVMPDGSSKVEIIPWEFTGKPVDGVFLLNHFMKNNMLYGGGSTYAAKASVLKKIAIPAGVDMFTDEFLLYALLPFGKSYFIEDDLSAWRNHGGNYSLIAPEAVQISKGKRLLSSSDALLNYLITHKYDKEVTDIYKLKNLTAHLAFKELTNTKSFRDIAAYFKEVFFTIKPDLRLIKQYHVLNRLIPTPLFKIMKSMFKGKHEGKLQSG